MADSSTRIDRLIRASRDRVYQALLDPSAVATWMVPQGMTSVVHEFDAREGGRFRITLFYEDAGGAGKTTAASDTYHGVFTELVPPEKVVEVLEFETADPAMQGEMTVTFSLADHLGATRLLAVHDHLPPGLSASDNETGWRVALDKLEAWLEGRLTAGREHTNEE